MPAIQLPIHRRAYLQYEGLVSNDRGSVKRVMSGTWKLLEMTPPNTLDGRFAQIVFQLTPDNIVLPLQLTLKRLTQDKFQITSWHRLGSPG